MYNQLYGECPHAEYLLFVINLRREDFGRYRDCFFIDGFIVVFTRLGKDTDGRYSNLIEALRNKRSYKCDWLDEIDDTYRYFKFGKEQAKIDIDLCKDIDTRYVGERLREDYGI